MGKRFIQTIKIKLGEEGQEGKRIEHEALDRELFEVEAEKASTAKDYNARIKDIRKAKRAILEELDTQSACVDVTCEQRINEQRGEVEVWRVDTNEIIPELTRPLSLAERQTDWVEAQLELPPGAKPMPGEEPPEGDDIELEKMTKKELIDYARTKFDAVLGGKKDELIEKIRELMLARLGDKESKPADGEESETESAGVA